MSENKIKKLTEGNKLAKNSLFTISAQIIPIGIGLLTIPILISKLGPDVFGALTLIWAIIGFFSMFDFGIGRAITVLVSEKLVSNKIESDQKNEIAEIILTALTIIVVYSGLIILAIELNSQKLIEYIFDGSTQLKSEALNIVQTLAFTVPSVICSGCLMSFLAAHQKFKLISIVRLLSGSILFVGPLIVIVFSNSLTLICMSLALAKIIETLIYFYFSIKTNRKIWTNKKINIFYIKPLLSYGGWMTISNIIGAIMNYVDRFFVAVLLTTAAVAYYVTPSDLIVRFMIVPGAIVGVLFPAFCATYKINNERTNYLFKRGIIFILILVYPVILVASTLSSELLLIWLGEDFSSRSALTLQIMAVGGLANSITYIPFAIIQAAGRPDLTGKFHIIELPIFVLLAYFLIKNFGIEGAAIGWMLRSMIDALILMILADHLMPDRNYLPKLLYVITGLMFLLIIPMAFDMSIMEKIIYLCLSILSLGAMTYLKVLEDNDKRILLNYIRLK